MRSVPSLSSRVPASVSDQRVSRPRRCPEIQPLSAVRMIAWRVAFSATSRSASRSSSVAVHTEVLAGSTNSPRTVSRRLRALAAPSSWRRVTNGPSSPSTPVMVSEPVVFHVDVAAALLVPRAHRLVAAAVVRPVRSGGRPVPLGGVAGLPGVVRTGRRTHRGRADPLAQPAVLGGREAVPLQPGAHRVPLGMARPDDVDHVVQPARGRLLLEVLDDE